MKLIHLTLENGEAFYVNPDYVAAVFDSRGPYQVRATIVLSNEIHYDLAGNATEVINYILDKVSKS